MCDIQALVEAYLSELVLTPELQSLIRRYEELRGKAPVSEILKTVLEAHLKKIDPIQAIDPQAQTAVSAKRRASCGRPSSPGSRRARRARRNSASSRRRRSCAAGGRGDGPGPAAA